MLLLFKLLHVQCVCLSPIHLPPKGHCLPKETFSTRKIKNAKQIVHMHAMPCLTAERRGKKVAKREGGGGEGGDGGVHGRHVRWGFHGMS